MSNLLQFTGGIKSIQRGAITIAASSPQQTATISAVTLAKAELRFLGCSNSAGEAGAIARIGLTNATTITATRGNLGGETITSWELTEYY
ncbi:MAG TPA: hypothetical protein VMS38_12650 [Pseudorhodoferax sp.]|nr:hypothetical protein [Pseudorhodoferax sp.]